MFYPNASHQRNRPWVGGRGPGNMGEFGGAFQPPAVFITGVGAPSWPRIPAFGKFQQALPRVDTKRQVKADARLRAKGGADWLNSPWEKPRKAA